MVNAPLYPQAGQPPIQPLLVRRAPILLAICSALKNDLASATAKHKQGLSGEGAPHCEADIYANNRHLLRLSGAQIEEGKPEIAGGNELPMFPMVSVSPFFATCLTVLLILLRK